MRLRVFSSVLLMALTVAFSAQAEGDFAPKRRTSAAGGFQAMTDAESFSAPFAGGQSGQADPAAIARSKPASASADAAGHHDDSRAAHAGPASSSQDAGGGPATKVEGATNLNGAAVDVQTTSGGQHSRGCTSVGHISGSGC